MGVQEAPDGDKRFRVPRVNVHCRAVAEAGLWRRHVAAGSPGNSLAWLPLAFLFVTVS